MVVRRKRADIGLGIDMIWSTEQVEKEGSVILPMF